MNLRPTDYESVALPLSYTGNEKNLTLLLPRFTALIYKPELGSNKLDPNVRARLIKELKSPWRGLRRALWIAFAGSSGIGLFVMIVRNISGEIVSLNDAGIQVCAFAFFSFLLFIDRQRNDAK